MGLTYSNKELSTDVIDCNESFTVKLSLTAAPDIVENPTDIVLALDRSGSMRGSAIAALKVAAKAFIDIIDEATDGTQDGEIGSGSRIAVVSFADTATADTQLITSVSDLKDAIDALSADGNTNHAAAFTTANELLAEPSTNANVIIMFTDGKATVGDDPSPVAAAARDAGTVIYAIGLSGTNGVDEAALDDWASKPASSFVVITPDADKLVEIFENLAANITKTGATDILLTDKVSSCFRITDVLLPTKGTAVKQDDNTVQWSIDELGVTESEGAELEFIVEHIGPCTGTVEVNESIEYTDAEDNEADFPSPELTVDCDIVTYPEECPELVDLAVDGCEDTVELDAGDVGMESLGRVVMLDVRLRSVCPNRRVALAAILTEVDGNGIEHKRGMKTMVVPAHTRAECSDVMVRCIKFVLPESLNVSVAETSMCGGRNLRARFIAHYIDSDYECCNMLT